MRANAFTIGNKVAYDLAASEGATKVGRHDEYEGGCVWPTLQEAQSYLDQTGGWVKFGEDCPPVLCDVYGLILPNGWEMDVDSSQFPQDGFHRLINDAQIVALD